MTDKQLRTWRLLVVYSVFMYLQLFSKYREAAVVQCLGKLELVEDGILQCIIDVLCITAL